MTRFEPPLVITDQDFESTPEKVEAYRKAVCKLDEMMQHAGLYRSKFATVIAEMLAVNRTCDWERLKTEMEQRGSSLRKNAPEANVVMDVVNRVRAQITTGTIVALYLASGTIHVFGIGFDPDSFAFELIPGSIETPSHRDRIVGVDVWGDANPGGVTANEYRYIVKLRYRVFALLNIVCEFLQQIASENPTLADAFVDMLNDIGIPVPSDWKDSRLANPDRAERYLDPEKKLGGRRKMLPYSWASYHPEFIDDLKASEDRHAAELAERIQKYVDEKFPWTGDPDAVSDEYWQANAELARAIGNIQRIRRENDLGPDGKKKKK